MGRRWLRSPTFVLLAVSWAGCPAPSADLDADVPPVTDGDWWTPDVSSTWQWQLLGTPDLSYDVDIYDLDLFDVSDEVIEQVHDEGRLLLCYFSAGSYEDWREDADDFDERALGANLDGWPGERWLDVRAQTVVDVMTARLDLAVDRGCDGVEPDNVDGYSNNSGFPLTEEDQLAFDRWLGNAAHSRGLAVALKNDGEQVTDLVDYFDLVVNEQCHDFDECSDWSPFVEAGKPVLNAEYPGDEAAADEAAPDVCDASADLDFRTLLLPLDLDGSWRVTCD